MCYIRIGICDDEDIILDKISLLIQENFNLLNCDFETIKFNNANSLIKTHSEDNFDVVFLDIDMPVMNGLDAAQVIKTNNPNTVIIFITSKDELVYESFRVQPFRFIRKTKLTEEISEAIKETYKLLNNNSYKINVKIDNNVYEIGINSILYIESSRNYIIINTVSDKRYKYKDSINQKETELKDYGFIRTHLGYLVNLRYVQRLIGDSLLLKNNQKIPISRSRIQYVKQMLIEYLR